MIVRLRVGRGLQTEPFGDLCTKGFYGAVDEVTIWGGALTPAEITMLAGAGLTDPPATLGDLAAHIADPVDAHDASAISVADSGGHFAGTDVEAVLAELAAGAGSFDPATATNWWFPLFDSDGTAVLDGDGSIIPTLIPL